MKYLRPFSTHSDGDEQRAKGTSGNIYSSYNNKKKKEKKKMSNEMIRVGGWCSYLTLLVLREE